VLAGVIATWAVYVLRLSTLSEPSVYVLSWMTALLALVPALLQFFDASAWDT
jgi:hypothetical protein